MKELLRQALSASTADYCEIRLEETHVTSIEYRGKNLDQLAQRLQFGGNVRALVDGGWGFVSFNRIDDLTEKVSQACEQARALGAIKQGQSQMAEVPVVDTEVKTPVKLDPRAVTLEEKVNVFARYNELILGFHPSITGSVIRYFDRYINLYYVNTDGSYVAQEKYDIGCSLRAVATRDNVTVTEGVSTGSNNDFGCVLNLENDLKKACQLTVDLLDAPTVKGGEYTVILDPKLAGLFVHEAFGHLSEADDISENEALREIMTLGKKFGRDILHIYDTGMDSGNRGALLYDDEGVATEKTYLIKDGVLVGRLHSRESAAKMGEATTGSARAMSYTFPPIVRMRTTCIEAGTSSFQDMIKDIGLGVYALGGYGGQTNGEMFTFTAGHGYMIREGKIAELVKDVTLSGNVFTTLANIDMVGNDFTYDNTAGGCGKWAQSPLPTSEGSPHIRVQKVVIGGAS
ncbi:MAG: Metalloprotease TldD [Firmicutes bacterium]|nr:Metalloprotease TldD [Bacillota bacterium]